VGRAQELGEVRELLLTTRLLTLTGAGGTGKTRLALEAARASVEHFRDGVVLVLLGAIADPDLILPTLASAIGVQEVADRHLGESVIAYLRPRRMLLLVDNFEHLLGGATVITDVLESCPNVSALCTSRQPLGVRGEHEFAVQPLQLPPVDHSTPPDVLVNCASVVLLAQRTSDVVMGFSVNSKNARAVADICIRLDGLPLAIELVAARLKVLSPPELLERLTLRLPLLVGGPRDLPARQRTLRNTIAWSHDLLDPGDQRLFRRLAVFAGGFTLAAAEALCDEDTDLGRSVLDGLSGLVGLNLLQRQDMTGGEPRFAVLETIREFALEKLKQSGEAMRLRERHAEIFVQFAEHVEPYLATGGRAPWLARVATDQENLRAALRWSAEQCRPEPGLRIVGALWLFVFPQIPGGPIVGGGLAALAWRGPPKRDSCESTAHGRHHRMGCRRPTGRGALRN
jgi:predicted ATPase